MQNSCRKLILLTSPLLLWAACACYPVIDDWSYLTVPNFDGFLKPYYMLPRGNQWRPFDAVFGYMLSFRPTWFPWFNHLVIVVAHVINTLLVYSIGQHAGFKNHALCISTLLFYLSPAMAATVFNTDSINQVYSQLWGLAGLLICLRMRRRAKYTLWSITLLLAMLTKENGIMWAWVTPMLVYGIFRKDKSELKTMLLLGTFIAFIYLAARFSLSGEIVYTDSAYMNDGLLRHIRGFVMLVGYTFIPLDYVSIVYAPSRNWWVATFTLLLLLPFLVIFIKCFFKNFSSTTFILSAAILLLALPHLLTIFSALHAYAALSAGAWLTASVIQHETNRKRLTVCFAGYAAAMLITTGHHWLKSVESGETGKHLAKEVVRQSHRPAYNVLLIMQEDTSPKYSSFCAQPADAFGWGRAVCTETHYKWPEHITEIIVPTGQWNKRISELTAGSFPKDYDAVWIQKGKTITVLEK